MIERNITEQSVEQRTDLTTPVLAYVEASEQIAATRAFVASIKSHVQDQEKVRYTAEVERLLADSEDADCAKRLAINCFDFCISDEIRTYETSNSLPTDAAAVYFRSDVYKTQYPRCVTGAIEQRLGCAVEEAIIAPAVLVSETRIDGIRGALTEKIDYIVGNQNNSLDKSYPPLGMPRQELYRELMSCGINPFDATERPTTPIDSNENRVYRRLHRIRGSLALYAKEADLQNQRLRIESHWRTILGEPNGKGQVVLFSSGVSSNEASMRAIAEVSDRAYVHPYWYYENAAAINTIFNSIEQDLGKATALLVNLEPTNYFTFEEQPEPPVVAIKQFVDQAIENPNQQYSLIIDATVDPLISLRTVFGYGHLPSNLTIIKTASATKHQDGGRNYFFGVAYVEDTEVNERIRKNQLVAGSILYESHILHFPLPSRERIEHRRSVTSQLGAALETLNKQGGWRYVAYSYHSFLVPPQEFIEQIVENVRHFDCQRQAEEYIKIINSEIYAIVNTVALEEGGIEVGDSFAFPVTRVNTQGGPNRFGPYQLALKIPRISMGYRDGPTKGIHFAKMLIEQMKIKI
jgi:hypothetical protein